MAATNVLQSWKQIAKYVGRTERTVQRWEQGFGFPVHRPSGKSRSSVMALTQEIEEWTRAKPSLPQLQEMATVNRLELVSTSDDNPCFHRNSLSEQVRVHRLLTEEQKTLRKDIRNLVQEHRTLRQTLTQNLVKTLNCR